MKNLFFAALLGLTMTVGISSCSKCEVCTKTSEPETRYCRKDYNTSTEFGAVIDAKEAMGFDCKSSI